MGFQVLQPGEGPHNGLGVEGVTMPTLCGARLVSLGDQRPGN